MHDITFFNRFVHNLLMNVPAKDQNVTFTFYDFLNFICLWLSGLQSLALVNWLTLGPSLFAVLSNLWHTRCFKWMCFCHGDLFLSFHLHPPIECIKMKEQAKKIAHPKMLNIEALPNALGDVNNCWCSGFCRNSRKVLLIFCGWQQQNESRAIKPHPIVLWLDWKKSFNS